MMASPVSAFLLRWIRAKRRLNYHHLRRALLRLARNPRYSPRRRATYLRVVRGLRGQS